MRLSRIVACLLVAATFGIGLVAHGAGGTLRFADQGAAWTPALRAAFYGQDQGSQMIPRAWLDALRQPDGQPFLADGLARYGYLPNPESNAGLPVGFTQAAGPGGDVVGMTCSACHTRQIEVDGAAMRIDGAPAMADFGAFVADLDAAARRVAQDARTNNDAAFADFARTVLKERAIDPEARAILRTEVRVWSLRFHTLVAGSLPSKRPWGPTRLDAIAVIYNYLSALDVGPPPTYLIPANVQPGDAPTRYPFLWNAARQDFTQWTGVAENGNAGLALARSLSEIAGVFGTFHPRPAPSGPLNRNYLADNSASLAGMAAVEAMIDRIGPPVWPWPVDRALARDGQAIFERPAATGGCVACHGQRPGVARPPNLDTWKTPLVDVGTDTQAWRVLLRSVRTGSMEGASVPGAVAPLKSTDLSLNLLKATILGTIVDLQATGQIPAAKTPAAQMPPAQMPPAKTPVAPVMHVPEAAAAAPNIDVYEARVLKGVWAAAPYLHNGSVPSLADLLEPADRRPRSFTIGPAYDPARVGLAAIQRGSAFVLHTTGCEDRASGDSACGHEYGTRLPPGDKRALLEYLKTL